MNLKLQLKRAALGAGTIGVIIAGAAAFSAFEAHVINVTARIENALRVETQFIDYGTVFPQEHLEVPVEVALSQSFLDEDRVDDVEYFFRQKPKCAITSEDGTVADLTVGPDGSHMFTGTGHVVVGDDPSTPNVEEASFINCGDAPRTLLLGEVWGVLPDLCPYISKDGEQEDVDVTGGVDGVTPSFHTPYTIVGDVINWLDTPGRLAKSIGDTVDNWIIDLSVPCFGGFCAQDWADFVHSQNPDANPDEFTQPIANEHKVFGCDLWIEVSGISVPGLGCQGKIDLMVVVDRSGSIGATDMGTVKTSLHAFVDALGLQADGPHAGQVSFAIAGSLDQQLTDSPAAMHAAINTLVSDGTTNLTEGIDLAQQEFDSVRDRADAPNIMLVITDGVPNVCIDGLCELPNEAENEAAAAAAASRADGTEIFVVGIGDELNPTYLENEIASPANSTNPQHYFSSTDFSTLQTILVDIATCEDEE